VLRRRSCVDFFQPIHEWTVLHVLLAIAILFRRFQFFVAIEVFIHDMIFLTLEVLRSSWRLQFLRSRLPSSSALRLQRRVQGSLDFEDCLLSNDTGLAWRTAGRSMRQGMCLRKLIRSSADRLPLLFLRFAPSIYTLTEVVRRV